VIISYGPKEGNFESCVAMISVAADVLVEVHQLA
jgi:hypothetical protein